jgi:hypothetical protein
MTLGFGSTIPYPLGSLYRKSLYLPHRGEEKLKERKGGGNYGCVG